MRDGRRRPAVPTLLIIVSATIFHFGGTALRGSFAQGTGPRSGTSSTIPSDDLQRSARFDNYTLTADHGVARGENIYFYKCWMCHNKYAQSAPYLHALYEHSTLISGKAVSDVSVGDHIKTGSAAMPAFGTTLSDSEIADLVTYIRSGKCCVEGEEPPPNPWYRAATNKRAVQNTLSGGPHGIVHIASGETSEGIGVQLIAANGVRTTVYTNINGWYEFPTMQAGTYILRIPTPREFKPYRRDSVTVDGPTTLDDIVLERVAGSDALPPTSEIESQLSGAELLWNLPGTIQEKAAFQKNCSPCHGWKQILKNRYDEHSWRLILDRMMHYSTAALVVPKARSAALDSDFNSILKWLSTVRSPQFQDPPLHVFSRPQGAATRVVITEYELPRALLAPHDVAGDSQGNIWYTSHKTRFIGNIDPRTGIATEYKIPMTPNAMPGTHRVSIDKNDVVFASEPWAHKLDKVDAKTGKIEQIPIEVAEPLNFAAFTNFALGPDDSVWDNEGHYVRKIDPITGKILQRFPNQTEFSYDNLISADGKYWAGGGHPFSGNTAERLDIRTGNMIGLNTGPHNATAKRGGFDPSDNAWFGGGDGALIELDASAKRIVEHWPPTAPSPFTDFYEAMPDKNDEVWAGVLNGRQIVRFDPRSERWTVYQLPEPYAYDRRTWIDNSSNPVTVWYVDYNGVLVRVQPLD